MVRINCFFQANEGQYDAALQAALALTAASQKQEGCVSYDVFESGTRSDVFMFCETWTNAETPPPRFLIHYKDYLISEYTSLASCTVTSRHSASRAMSFL